MTTLVPGDVPARLRGAAAGYVLDRLLGEPPSPVHPLRAFAWTMASIERLVYRDDRRTGALYATCGVGTGALAGVLVRSTVGATFLACGGRALGDEAARVDLSLRDGDLEQARRDVRSLVGRDSARLDAGELARAAVESVAENTVDAVIAPLLFAALGGAPGVLVHRAANTLDALVGYRSSRYERFGWASARVDDVMNFAPARLTALLVLAVRPRQATRVWRVVRRDARAHPSPNAGVAEAAFAAALGLRLGGESSYGGVPETRPFLGDGRVPERDDIARAVRLSHDVGTAASVALGVSALSLRARARARARARSGSGSGSGSGSARRASLQQAGAS